MALGTGVAYNDSNGILSTMRLGKSIRKRIGQQRMDMDDTDGDWEF